jgi:hypothetical protein
MSKTLVVDLETYPDRLSSAWVDRPVFFDSKNTKNFGSPFEDAFKKTTLVGSKQTPPPLSSFPEERTVPVPALKPEGRLAMYEWLKKHQIKYREVEVTIPRGGQIVKGFAYVFKRPKQAMFFKLTWY